MVVSIWAEGGRGWKGAGRRVGCWKVVDGRDVLQSLAGTTMHLIINSLDTRRWMSDGVSPGADGGQRGESRGEGSVCCRSKYGGTKGSRRRLEERMVIWRKVGGAEGGG